MAVEFPVCAFWDFSLDLYARPGVADCCLRLQGRHGLDVNLLFYCLWTAEQGALLSDDDVAKLMASVEGLHHEVIRPLRAARTRLKTMLAEAPAKLAPAMGRVRADIKRNELDAEHLEQLLLAQWRPAGTARLTMGADRYAVAAANAQAYFTALGVPLSPDDQADLKTILAALAR